MPRATLNKILTHLFRFYFSSFHNRLNLQDAIGASGHLVLLSPGSITAVRFLHGLAECGVVRACSGGGWSGTYTDPLLSAARHTHGLSVHPQHKHTLPPMHTHRTHDYNLGLKKVLFDIKFKDEIIIFRNAYSIA